MKKEDFLNTITILATAYGKELEMSQLEIWYSILKDYSIEELNEAVKKLINTCKIFPTVAHIKEEIAKAKLGDIPEAEEEWRAVINAVHNWGSYREKEALASLKPHTAEIVKHIGYFRICTSTQEEQVWNKKEFIGEYNSLVSKEMNNIQIGNKERKLLSE